MHDELTDEETIAQELEAAARVRRIRARHALQEAPQLAGWIRVNAIHTHGASERGYLPASSTPLQTHRTDDADELYSQLIDWVTYWRRWIEFQVDPTHPRAWSRIDENSPARCPQRENLGYRAGETSTTAYLLVNLQALWLLRHDDQIALHPNAYWYYEAITEIVWRMRGQYALTKARERGVIGGRCEACGELGVHAQWTGTGILDVEVKCEPCGEIVPNPRPSVIERAVRESVPSDLLSDACDQGRHTGRDRCDSILCECACHRTEPLPIGYGAPTHIKNDGLVPRLPKSTKPANPHVCQTCWLIHPEGACQ